MDKNRWAAATFLTATVGSLPVNIPDWSKILREDYRDNRRREADDDDDDEDDDGDSSSRVPPHENAIWEKTGFQD
ncbi:unnamed protein product, partial [Vitis vinifera]